MTRKHRVRIATMVAGFLPALAVAHPGHGETSSFVTGALHAFGGIDHLVGFVAVGFLAASLGGRRLWPLGAAFLGLLVATSTAGSDGWRYAAGFMFTGAGLIAAAMVATKVATRAATSFGFRFFTATSTRSPT